MNALFDKEWPEFPQLRNSIDCLKNAGGAAKADLWRYLALWVYGGIYTDMDNSPGISPVTLNSSGDIVKVSQIQLIN